MMGLDNYRFNFVFEYCTEMNMYTIIFEKYKKKKKNYDNQAFYEINKIKITKYKIMIN